MHARSNLLSANAAMYRSACLHAYLLQFIIHCTPAGLLECKSHITIALSPPLQNSIYKHKKQTHYHGFRVPLGTSPCPSLSLPTLPATHSSSYWGLPVPPRLSALSYPRLHTSWNALLHFLPSSVSATLRPSFTTLSPK